MVIFAGGWFTREFQPHSCALLCLHFWGEWLYHSILILVQEILPSMETLRHRGIGWRSPLICQSRNGIATAQPMISATGDLTTLPLLPTRAISMVYFSDSSILNQFLFSLLKAMNLILGLYYQTFFFIENFFFSIFLISSK